MIRNSIFLLLIAFSLITSGQTNSHPLNGSWFFALDPLKVGEREGWTSPDFPNNQLDKVVVPHSFSVDKRYLFYTGTSWYFKKFDIKLPQNGDRAFINFDAVFYKCSVWLNGNKVGSHEGGYTPFVLEVTPYLKEKNVLSVLTDNSWDTTTIPGARTRDSTYNAVASQVYPWINYGGITKPVNLTIRPALYIGNIKIQTEPDLKKGNANVSIRAFIKNLSSSDTSALLHAGIFGGDKKMLKAFKPVPIRVRGGMIQDVLLDGVLPAKDVQLWSHDNPYLYSLEVTTGEDTVRVKFGIRKIEIRGTQLLLNGKAIRMGGCNRPADYPGLGSLDPDSILQKDLTLIKSSGMELSRIAHHAVSKDLLDWADEHGLLIITEGGNWQLSPKQMADSVIRQKYRSQMKEMIERDWNHPSVIAYSLGNEFYSQKEEGKAWVRDMSSFTRKLDNTRLITFASNIVFRDYIKKPEDEASRYVDFVSANVYANHTKWIEKIHLLYPSKPVYISEFGIMATVNKTEMDRISYLKKAIEAFRKADYVVGASIWTFNDYLSRFPLSNPDGYRAWGIVTPNREQRESYQVIQHEFSPALIEIVSRQPEKLIVRVRSRNDFPSYILKGYVLKFQNQTVNLPVLQPGDTHVVSFNIKSGNSDTALIELIKPGGFVILTESVAK